ncbi:MAG: DUF2950 domain-containing protein [Verrucomicrobiia bacterium]|jgi:hypothetical protein
MKITMQIVLVAGLASAWTTPAVIAATEDSQQSLFVSPDQAVVALQDAVKTGDTNALQRLFGPSIREITNPDPVQRANNLANFAKRLAESIELAKQDNGTVVLRLGTEHWPFPIPLTQKGDKWFFDTLAGKEEILNRRIGGNELSALEVCHAYVKAQREYIQKDHDGNGVMEYAQRMQSTLGKKDGLYWATKPGEEESPFGPLVASACEEGYSQESVSATPRKHDPFHGYIFRILRKQGKDAPGGKFDYVINGHMVAGFALLAYPAQWGNSGVMTFIVNQQGKVYQKNLGEKTDELAKEIEEYNPDETWKPSE